MTRNQISYWELIENKRANLAREAETGRHNLATEDLSLQSLRESARHNLIQESLSERSLEESYRHNTAAEELDEQRIMLNYELGKYTSELSSAASRYVGDVRAAASRYSADISRELGILHDSTNMYLGSLSANETERSNKARETQNRINSNREYDYKTQSLGLQETQIANQYALGMENVYIGVQNAKSNSQNALSNRLRSLGEVTSNLLGSLGNLSRSVTAMMG